jgi:1-acyl-sn-glycerol-3-phosphate acyltransferase
MTDNGPSGRRRPVRSVFDFLITILLWTYFTAGFVFFFAPFYLWASLFSRNREESFQGLNCKFYRGFFSLVRILMPAHRWDIQPEVMAIRSSVIVCNHRSYLDPILLISLYAKHSTIVKRELFDIPLFGSMLRWSGYIPSSSEGRFGEMMLRRIEEMDAFIAGGGNLIVFPEGTRSRNGRIGPMNKGAFKIARQCRAPIKVLFVRNTDRMFRQGSFSFNTRGPNTISLEVIGGVDSAQDGEKASLSRVIDEVRSLLVSRNEYGVVS